MRDHPRMCGDHFIEISFRKSVEGSPPHVRGPPRVGTPTEKKVGITPACAGTTKCGLSRGRLDRDHPRMCGDHAASSYQTATISGSPPHVRGPLSRWHNI